MDAEGTLFDVPELAGDGRAGAAEAGLRAALDAATTSAQDGRVTELDAGLVGSAIQGARALDAAGRLLARAPKDGGYLIAALLTPYRETLAALGLPEPRAGGELPAGGPAAATDWSSVFGTAE